MIPLRRDIRAKLLDILVFSTIMFGTIVSFHPFV